MNKFGLLFLVLFFAISCKNDADHSRHQHKEDKAKDHRGEKKTKSYYTCSMHPQIREERPGKCPICHMSLTKVEIDDSGDEEEGVVVEKTHSEVWACANFPDVTSERPEVCPIDGTDMILKRSGNRAGKVIGKVKLRKAQLEHFRPSFFPVSKMEMVKKVRLLGAVMQSEERESNIPARIGGRVEKVYVKSTGSLVKIGDPVVGLYSPKLISAGEEYLLARKSSRKSNSTEFKEMLVQSEERLKLWGIKAFQFESWYSKMKVPKRIIIYSPATGIVRKRNATIGKYFKEGQNFFELSDLSDVWVEMDVYEHDSALVKLGQGVELKFTSLPGEVLNGEIDFVNPVLDEKSRTLKIRTTIKNTTGKLRPGMVANAVLNIKIDGRPLVVPRSAIIDTGKRKVVWVKVSHKKFQAKIVHSGYESEGYVEIKEGLSEGEEVVIDGNFLLDAQAQLFGGFEDFKGSKGVVH